MYPSTLQLSEGMIYVNESGKIFPVGQKGETPDGRVFRHSLTGAGINASALCQNRATDSSWDTCAIPTGYSVVVGDNKIRITNQSDAWALNELENGFLVCETDPSNLGPNCWRIGGNDAASASTGPLIIYLADGLTFGQALVAGTDTMLYMPSLYSKVIVSPTTTTGISVGVTMRKLTSGYYGWIQTHGVCGVIFDNNGGDNTIGEALVADLTSAGRVENVTQKAQFQHIGATITVEGQTDGDVMLIYLHIE